METKKFYFSRTFWVEFLQALIGFLTGVILILNQGFSPEAVGALLVGIKGIYGVYLRFTTTQPISL